MSSSRLDDGSTTTRWWSDPVLGRAYRGMRKNTEVSQSKRVQCTSYSVLAFAHTTSTLYEGHCTRFDCDTSVFFRIPRYARPNTGSDHHLVVRSEERRVGK